MRLARWSVALAAVLLGHYLPFYALWSECVSSPQARAKKEIESAGTATDEAIPPAPGSLKLQDGTYKVPPGLLRRLLYEAESLLEAEIELLLRHTAAQFVVSDEAVYRRWLAALKTFAQDEEARGHLGPSEEKLIEMMGDGGGSNEF